MQSLICGAPVASISMLAGAAVLMHNRAQSQRADWRAITGIVLGVLFFLAASVLTVVLLTPFLFWGAG